MKGLYLTCCIIFFQLKRVFFRSFISQRIRQTTNIPSRTMKTTSKVRSEHTQSLHYMHITPFFTCLNFIPPIKFHWSILDYALSRAISWWTTYILSHILTVLSNPTEKKNYMKLNATDSGYFTQFSRVLTFPQIKFAFSCVGPNPLRVNSF